MRSVRVGVAVGALLMLGVAAGGFAFLTGEGPLERPCPDGFRRERALSVHMGPTLVEHQNWLSFPYANDADDAWVFVCVRGRGLGRMKSEYLQVDASTGLARLPIPTRWVDAMWLTRRLDPYREPIQWEAVFAATDW
jgi:hypothetical protein